MKVMRLIGSTAFAVGPNYWSTALRSNSANRSGGSKAFPRNGPSSFRHTSCVKQTTKEPFVAEAIVLC